jgi:hypothetical protein
MLIRLVPWIKREKRESDKAESNENYRNIRNTPPFKGGKVIFNANFLIHFG